MYELRLQFFLFNLFDYWLLFKKKKRLTESEQATAWIK